VLEVAFILELIIQVCEIDEVLVARDVVELALLVRANYFTFDAVGSLAFKRLQIGREIQLTL
jgi:hypothetical protein